MHNMCRLRISNTSEIHSLGAYPVYIWTQHASLNGSEINLLI